MEQPLFGIVVVILLFVSCLVMSYIIALARLGHKKSRTPPANTQVFYIDGAKLVKQKKPRENRVTIPFEATIMSDDEIDRHFN